MIPSTASICTTIGLNTPEAANAKRLACDYAAISDGTFYSKDEPSVMYGLRGLLYMEATLTGPNRDLHSGHYGGGVVNPLNALVELLAGLHDHAGRVTVKGFYDDVLDLSPEEREALMERMRQRGAGGPGRERGGRRSGGDENDGAGGRP